MPFYTWLQPQSQDCEMTLQTKLRAAEKIKALRVALEAHISNAKTSEEIELPSDSRKFVRIATWNIREFDSSKYGFRSQEAKAYIAEILSYFDLVALQEIRHDLEALDDIRQLLGPSWNYIATDVTEGSSGNQERMAFLYNGDKVRFNNVAGELTLPKGQKVTDPFGNRFKVEGGAKLELPPGKTIVSREKLKTDTLKSGETKLKEDVEIPLPKGTRLVLPCDSSLRFAKNARIPIDQAGRIDIERTRAPLLPGAAEIVLPPNSIVGGAMQFARTPFIASFQAGWLKINLVTVHIYYGSGSAGMERRKEEIRRLTALLATRAQNESDSDADSHFIALGDFNIVGRAHGTMDALKTNGFEIPQPLQAVCGSNVKQDKFYDQIALWTGKSSRRKKYTSIRPYRAGVFDFFEIVYRTDEEKIYRSFMHKPNSEDFFKSYTTWRTYQMSDHLPMWVELHVDFVDDYLEATMENINQNIQRKS